MAASTRGRGRRCGAARGRRGHRGAAARNHGAPGPQGSKVVAPRRRRACIQLGARHSSSSPPAAAKGAQQCAAAGAVPGNEGEPAAKTHAALAVLGWRHRTASDRLCGPTAPSRPAARSLAAFAWQATGVGAAPRAAHASASHREKRAHATIWLQQISAATSTPVSTGAPEWQRKTRRQPRRPTQSRRAPKCIRCAAKPGISAYLPGHRRRASAP